MLSLALELLFEKIMNTKQAIKCYFSITLHYKDRALLEMIKASFNGVGTITKSTKDYKISC